MWDVFSYGCAVAEVTNGGVMLVKRGRVSEVNQDTAVIPVRKRSVLGQ